MPWSHLSLLHFGSQRECLRSHPSTPQEDTSPSKRRRVAGHPLHCSGGGLSSSSFTRVGVTHTSTTQEGEGRRHGHLLPFFPLEVRWSDNDRRPHLLQKRSPSKKRRVEGILPPFSAKGRWSGSSSPNFTRTMVK